MITLVDVTGSYIFGFGSRSAAIGSLTRGISPLNPMKIGSYSIATSNRITSIQSPKNITTFVRFATMLIFEHSFVKTTILSSSYSIATTNNFTAIQPAKVFTNNAINNIYKYAGLSTQKLFTILNNSKLRFDVGAILYTPKIISVKFYLNTELFKTTFPIIPKLVSFIKYPYVFGDNPSIDIMRSAFFGMTLPVFGNVRYTSLNTPLDKIAFSFCGPGEVLSVKFYRDTELFKTSTIKASSPFSKIQELQTIFGGTSTIKAPVIISLTDYKFTTTFNYGSGMNTSYLANILTKLNSEYSTVPFTGMRIVKIYSALPPGWQQTDQTPTKILIQFWS